MEEFEAEKQEKTVNPNANKPLLNMIFSTHGKLSRKNDEIKTILTRLGASLISSLDNLTVALITNEGRKTQLLFEFILKSSSSIENF